MPHVPIMNSNPSNPEQHVKLEKRLKSIDLVGIRKTHFVHTLLGPVASYDGALWPQINLPVSGVYSGSVIKIIVPGLQSPRTREVRGVLSRGETGHDLDITVSRASSSGLRRRPSLAG